MFFGLSLIRASLFSTIDKMQHQIGQFGCTAFKLAKRSVACDCIIGVSRAVLILAVTAALAINSNSTAAQKTEKYTFDDHIKPILMNRCSTCHNPQKREG